MPPLKDLHPKNQRARVAVALRDVLDHLTVPVGTVDIVERVAARLGVDKKDYAHLSRLILANAGDYPEAKQSSVTYRKFGKEMRRWIWSPKF